MIKTAFMGFESSTDCFHLSPDVDEGFRLSGSRDTGIFEVGEHEIKFGVHEKIHTLLKVPGVSPPLFLSQGIPFSHGLGSRLGEVKEIPEFFFKEENLFDGGPFVDFNHLRDEKMFFFSPSVHMFKQSPFHLPEFFSVEGPAFSLKRLSELDQSIFEVLPESLHDVEVIVLEGSFRPDFTDDFGEGGPEVKDDAVGVDAPAIELSEELFSDPTAVKPRDGFDIKDSHLDGISGDLFITASSSGHIFINREGSRELELAEDIREIVFGGEALFPSIHGRFRSRAIKGSRQPLRDSFQGAIVLDDSSYGFGDEGLSSPLVSFNPFDGKRKAFVGATWVSTFSIDHPNLE